MTNLSWGGKHQGKADETHDREIQGKNRNEILCHSSLNNIGSFWQVN
jgi:hypothetical protein